MVTKDIEADIRNILRPLMDNAIEQIAEKDTISLYYPSDMSERLADITAQVIVLMSQSLQESQES